MRQPNHIILDFQKNSTNTSTEHWAVSYIKLQGQTEKLFNTSTITHNNFKGTLPKNEFRLLTTDKFDLKVFIQNMNLLVDKDTVSKLTVPTNLTTKPLNINFIRREVLYTKLKYSRSPAYDIVSGGAAAIFAGLLGFLISEKFGTELVDSGDFYYLFMYLVFLAFSLRPLLTVVESKKSFLHVFSLRRVYQFYVVIFTNIFMYLKS